MQSVPKRSLGDNIGVHHSDAGKEINTRSFGERLREERLRLGLTQNEMAEIGGVTRTTQHIYETDIRLPDLGYLNRVRQAGADWYYLFTGERQGLHGPDTVTFTRTTLSNIYDAMENLAFDAEGKLLPFEKRKLMFQMLCASMTVHAGDSKTLDALREELAGYRIK